MELTLTTGLAYADVGRALMAAFPGEGVTARPTSAYASPVVRVSSISRSR